MTAEFIGSSPNIYEVFDTINNDEQEIQYPNIEHIQSAVQNALDAADIRYETHGWMAEDENISKRLQWSGLVTQTFLSEFIRVDNIEGQLKKLLEKQNESGKNVTDFRLQSGNVLSKSQQAIYRDLFEKDVAMSLQIQETLEQLRQDYKIEILDLRVEDLLNMIKRQVLHHLEAGLVYIDHHVLDNAVETHFRPIWQEIERKKAEISLQKNLELYKREKDAGFIHQDEPELIVNSIPNAVTPNQAITTYLLSKPPAIPDETRPQPHISEEEGANDLSISSQILQLASRAGGITRKELLDSIYGHEKDASVAARKLSQILQYIQKHVIPKRNGKLTHNRTGNTFTYTYTEAQLTNTQAANFAIEQSPHARKSDVEPYIAIEVPGLKDVYLDTTTLKYVQKNGDEYVELVVKGHIIGEDVNLLYELAGELLGNNISITPPSELAPVPLVLNLNQETAFNLLLQSFLVEFGMDELETRTLMHQAILNSNALGESSWMRASKSKSPVSKVKGEISAQLRREMKNLYKTRSNKNTN